MRQGKLCAISGICYGAQPATNGVTPHVESGCPGTSSGGVSQQTELKIG